MMMTIHSEYGSVSGAAAAVGCPAAAVSFVEKRLSFMTPILMHGVCLT